MAYQKGDVRIILELYSGYIGVIILNEPNKFRNSPIPERSPNNTVFYIILILAPYTTAVSMSLFMSLLFYYPFFKFKVAP